VSTVAAGLLLALFVLMRQAWRRRAADPASADKVSRLRRALGRR